MKPTILLVSFVFSPNLGGIETHLDDLCAQLTQKGHVVTVITYQPLISSFSAPIVENHDHLTIIRIPWFKGNLYQKLENNPLGQILYLVPPILLCSFVYLFFTRKSIRVIQTHGFIMAIVGAILSVISGIPFTVHTHVSFRFLRGSFYAKILLRVLRRAKCVLVLTPDAMQELVRLGLDRSIIRIYHYWVDAVFEPRDKKECRKILSLTPDAFIVLFVGRFIRDKGVQIVLETAEKLRNIAFLFIGSGELSGDVKQMAKQHSNIRYEGIQDREHLSYYYSASDVCVIPSLLKDKTYTEGIPRVMIESFSCGTPVVSTKAGGLKTYITTHVGFIIAPDVSSLVKKLSWIMKHRSVLLSMSHHCISLSHSEFSMKRNLGIIEASLS